MRVALFLTASAAMIAAAPSATLAQVDVSRERTGRLESDFAPPVDLWLDQISYDRGAHMRPYFTTEPGAYVVVVRVSSDGELRVMYPERPTEQRPFVIGQFSEDRLPYRGDPSFRLYESSGTGFVFAIASYQRFDFSYFAQGRTWSTARLASYGRYGDPFQVVRGFVERVLPESAEYSLDYEVYEVYARGNSSVYANNVYSTGIYGSRYGYRSLSDYHDACLTAFGFRYTSHCRSFTGRYYGPIIVGTPRGNPRGTPRNPTKGERMKRPRPVSPDPLVPLESPSTEGRQPVRSTSERIARERYERMKRQSETRNPASGPILLSPGVDRGQRSDTRERAPVIYRGTTTRSEPRSEPRPQPRSEPRAAEGRQPERVTPRTPARVEVRNEPVARPARPVERARPQREKEN